MSRVEDQVRLRDHLDFSNGPYDLAIRRLAKTLTPSYGANELSIRPTQRAVAR